jgi:hypothetical protein
MYDDGKLRFLEDYGGASSNYIDLYSDGSYDDGQWHHVVVVSDRDSSLQIFVDGQLDGEAIQGDNVDISSPGQPVQVGQLNGGTWFDGPMDEFAIYDYALTDAQILAQYQTALIPEPSGLVLLVAGVLFLLGVVRIHPKPRG